MNGPHRDQGGTAAIILPVILYIMFNPIPGPIDDDGAALGGYHALKRL